MLTIIIKAGNNSFDVIDKHEKFFKIARNFDKAVNYILLAHENCPYIFELKKIATSYDMHELLITDMKTTEEEMIAMGLFIAKGHDALLCTFDTTTEIFEELLTKRKDDYKIVRVKNKTKTINRFFRIIGNWSYNIGLKLLGKTSDNFSEEEVYFLSDGIINSLTQDMANTRENRISNTFKNAKSMTVEDCLVYDNVSKTKNEQTMTRWGIVTLFYILGLVAVTSIYPFFHNYMYSWWMIILIVLYVALGLLVALIQAKKTSFYRIGLRNRVNSFGEPLFGFSAYYKTGDKIIEKRPLPKIDKIIIKNKIKIKR